MSMSDDLLSLIKENRAEIERELQSLEINGSNRCEVAKRILPFLAHFNHSLVAVQIIVFDALTRMRTARSLQCFSENNFNVKKTLKQLDGELRTPGKGSIITVIEKLFCTALRALDEETAEETKTLDPHTI
jgi:hypothetical protein